MDYRAGNIGSEIQQFLAASSQEHSCGQFASFIRANDIGLFILALINIISHPAFSAINPYA
jgi:hypothetical protein